MDATDQGRCDRVLIVFKSCDVNNDGVIDREELQSVLQELNPGYWNQERLSGLMGVIDTNKDGSINYEELLAYLYDKPAHQLFKVPARDASESHDASKNDRFIQGELSTLSKDKGDVEATRMKALAKEAIALDAGDHSTTPTQILLNTLGGDTFELEVPGDMSIAALKIAASQKVFHDSELDSFTSLSLMVGERKLGGDDDQLSLVAAGIQQGASVVVVKEQFDRDQALAVLKQLTKDTNFTLDAKQLILNGRADLAALPKEIGLLKKVTFLKIDNCEGLRALPKEIGLLTDLRRLQLTRCFSLTALPKEIGQLKNLVALVLGDYLGGCTSLTALPREIGNLDKLQCLNLRYCVGLKENIETKQMIQQLKETRGDAIKIFHVQSVWPDLPDLDRES